MFRIGVVGSPGALIAGGLWIAALALFGSAAAGGTVLPPGTVRVDLDPRPGWVVSGVWSHDGGELLLVDAFRSKILRFSAAGPSSVPHFLGDRDVPLRGSTEISRPSWIQKWGDGYLVEQEDGDFVELSPSLEPRNEVDVLETAVGSGGQVTAIFGWAPLGSSLVTFGDLRNRGSAPEQAFLRIPLRQPAAFEKLHVLHGAERAWTFYLLGYPYIASLGDRVYFIEMSSSPSIFEIGGDEGASGVRALSAFPSGFGAFPALPVSSDLRHVPALFETVERCRMVVGLYGWGGRLFVLARRPGVASDETVWTLTRIDPQKDEVVDTLELPTTASHVTVIPGPKHWAILEKGPVQGFGQQDISTLLLIPSAWFAEASRAP